MTANHTTRMGLMSPVDSDTFSVADFADTFSRIDAAPGVVPVANYAALQALGWGTAQHGRKAIQLDNLAEWIWIAPTSSGTWKRTNSLGVLNRTSQVADVSTSIFSGRGVRVIQTPQIAAAGGRWLNVNAVFTTYHSLFDRGVVNASLYDNGNLVNTYGYFAAASPTNKNNTGTFDYYLQVQPGEVHQFSLSITTGYVGVFGNVYGTAGISGGVLTTTEV